MVLVSHYFIMSSWSLSSLSLDGCRVILTEKPSFFSSIVLRYVALFKMI